MFVYTVINSYCNATELQFAKRFSPSYWNVNIYVSHVDILRCMTAQNVISKHICKTRTELCKWWLPYSMAHRGSLMLSLLKALLTSVILSESSINLLFKQPYEGCLSGEKNTHISQLSRKISFILESCHIPFSVGILPILTQVRSVFLKGTR
jgi:hypothetical protein